MSPITPPPELVQQWYDQAKQDPCGPINWVAVRAAQWGADQELEACCEWLEKEREHLGWAYRLNPQTIRAARRPKPPSLKEQALEELAWIGKHLDMPLHNYCNAIHIIHRALEQLDD
jgi:hypothetical protein